MAFKILFVFECGAYDVAVVVNDAFVGILIYHSLLAQAFFAQPGQEFVQLRMIGAVAQLDA